MVQMDDIQMKEQRELFKVGKHSYRKSMEKTKVKPSAAYINLFKGYIGSGILALPYAFD